MILPARRTLQGSRLEHAQNHRDLPGMVNRVFHDSVKHSFVRIVTSRNLFRQILDGKSPNLLFEDLATLAPAGDEFVPRNRWPIPVRAANVAANYHSPQYRNGCTAKSAPGRTVDAVAWTALCQDRGHHCHKPIILAFHFARRSITTPWAGTVAKYSSPISATSV